MVKELVFADGCFDGLDMTDADLADLIAHLHSLNESGQLEEMAEPLDDDETDDIMEMLLSKPIHH